MPAAGVRYTEQRLRRDPRNTRQTRQLLGQASVERLHGRLHGQERRGEVHHRRLGHDQQVGAQAMESRGHAPLDAAEQREGAEDRARAQRDRQYQQNRAHPPPAQVLQRQPEVEPSGSSRHVSPESIPHRVE